MKPVPWYEKPTPRWLTAVYIAVPVLALSLLIGRDLKRHDFSVELDWLYSAAMFLWVCFSAFLAYNICMGARYCWRWLRGERGFDFDFDTLN